MSGKVTLYPSRREFEIDGEDSVLEAALRAGVALNYGCSNGNCGLCKARLLKGDVFKIRPHDHVIPEAEKAQGYFLMCSNSCRGQVEVEAFNATGPGDIPSQRVSTRIKKIRPLSDDVCLLHVQTPRTQRLRFLAGQSAHLTLGDNADAEIPIASCPCDDRNIEFHIRMDQDDPFARELRRMSANQTVELSGPSGDFILDEASHRPVVFIAMDTGFAPVKSLIEHAMQLEQAEQIHLYWLVDKNDSHYLHNLVRSWSDAFDNFFYHPASVKNIEQPEPLSAAVEEMLLQHPSIEQCDYYIAGNATFAAITRDLLIRRGVPEQQVHTSSPG